MKRTSLAFLIAPGVLAGSLSGCGGGAEEGAAG